MDYGKVRENVFPRNDRNDSHKRKPGWDNVSSVSCVLMVADNRRNCVTYTLRRDMSVDS